MRHAMKPCCPGTGCGLSPSRSTSMISMTSAICWVPLSPFHIQPSHLAPSTRYKCGLNLSLRFLCCCCFLKCVCKLYSFQIVLPPHLERIREKLAENSHELWAVTRIEQGWTYGPVCAHRTGYFCCLQYNLYTYNLLTWLFQFRDDNKKLHPCLVDFQSLPEPEKNYNLAMSGETLK